ncbi:hypothetical protein M408DRAFT_13225 [Serendipita vermifera MAFF 305830]|uniref:Uncharacterized protein n=1 Tax=Serendipita vermifera MAFF 305830 TaxID=933852 RepID=A0A0C3AIT4_SERVB|nr:hypothetical protein M408DRAFT_13225 [Serendipita vermifera MAFF 305830]
MPGVLPKSSFQMILRDSCAHQGHIDTANGAESILNPRSTILHTGESISVSTEGIVSTSGTATRVFTPPVSQSASAMVMRTSGSNNEASSFRKHKFWKSVGFDGRCAVKVEIRMEKSNLVPLVAFLFAMVIIGDIV